MQLASPWVTVLSRLVLLGLLLGLFHDVAATTINLEHRATATTRYIVSPKDGVDSTGRKIIEAFIKKTINKQKIYSYTNKRRKQFLWWVVECGRDEIKKIKNHKGVKSAHESMPMELAYSDELEPADEVSYFNQTLNDSPLMKRDYTPEFVKQLNAVKELRQISIPEVSSRPERWPDYVFKRAAGAGAVIFHIEMGCTTARLFSRNNHYRQRVDNELPETRIMEGIQASFSRVTGESPWGDESFPLSDSHSTCVIVKAAGTTYGAAKEVSVVPVKLGYLSQETLAEGMDEALSAIIDNQLHGRAIVLITMGSRYPLYPDDPRPDVQEVRFLADELFGQGVPIVIAAGNSARRGSSQRQNIDTMPPTLARVLPVINVGNVEWSGDFYHTSQRGPLLSISALGTDITCLDKNGRLKYDTGTSYSAPLVAAQIAILISTNDPDLPFNERGISGEEYVRRIKRYVEDKANCVRVPGGPKVLWNEATARDHRRVPAVC